MRDFGDTASTPAVAWVPVPSGRCMSMRITSGVTARATSTARATQSALATTSKPSSVRSRLTPSRHIG